MREAKRGAMREAKRGSMRETKRAVMREKKRAVMCNYMATDIRMSDSNRHQNER